MSLVLVHVFACTEQRVCRTGYSLHCHVQPSTVVATCAERTSSDGVLNELHAAVCSTAGTRGGICLMS